MMSNYIPLFPLFLYIYVICGVTYGMHGFNYVDEIAFVIVLYYYTCYIFEKKRMGALFALLLAFDVFYVVYSLNLGIISQPAIFQDLIQQSKSYFIFICIYDLSPSLTLKRKLTLKRCALCVGVVSTIIWSIDSLSYSLLIHPGYYGNILLASAILYLFCSTKTIMSCTVFFVLMTFGLICGRSKYYGEYIAAISIFFFLRNKIQFRIKYILFGLLSVFLILYVSWEKFHTYFLADNEEAARTMLYNVSFKIFKDYFPFGSGLGSYANDASKVYYSPLYPEYGLNYVWGLSPEKDNFIADTYYPTIIGQFGVLGVIAFLGFFFFILNELNLYYKKSGIITYRLCVLIVIAMLVESVAAPTIVASVGTVWMALLAIMMSDMKCKAVAGEIK